MIRYGWASKLVVNAKIATTSTTVGKYHRRNGRNRRTCARRMSRLRNEQARFAQPSNGALLHDSAGLETEQAIRCKVEKYYWMLSLSHLLPRWRCSNLLTHASQLLPLRRCHFPPRIQVAAPCLPDDLGRHSLRLGENFVDYHDPPRWIGRNYPQAYHRTITFLRLTFFLSSLGLRRPAWHFYRLRRVRGLLPRGRQARGLAHSPKTRSHTHMHTSRGVVTGDFARASGSHRARQPLFRVELPRSSGGLFCGK